MEQSQTEGAGGINMEVCNEDDIVVDGLDVERDIKAMDREFIMPAGQIIGLDQAVLQSIERCRRLKSQMCIDLQLIY